MKKIITSILLFFVAILIFMLVLPFGLLYQIIAIFKTKERSIYFSDYFFKLAQCVDQLGNVINRQLFNDVLLNKNSTNVFGNNQETISSVIGKNFETSCTGNCCSISPDITCA